jgi:hypothetical protein
VASIIPFVPRGVFDDEATRVMGEAFDAVCAEIHETSAPGPVHLVIARRIIAAARKGERDPGKLRKAGRAALYGIKTPSSPRD